MLWYCITTYLICLENLTYTIFPINRPFNNLDGTSYTMGTGSFPGVKRPGRGVDHPPPSSTEVEGREELYICSLSGPSWSVLGVNFMRHVDFLSRQPKYSFSVSLPTLQRLNTFPRTAPKRTEEKKYFLCFPAGVVACRFLLACATLTEKSHF